MQAGTNVRDIEGSQGFVASLRSEVASLRSEVASLRSEVEPTIPIAPAATIVQEAKPIADVGIQPAAPEVPLVPVSRSHSGDCRALIDTYVRGNRSESSRRLSSRNDIPAFLNSLGLVGKCAIQISYFL